MAIRQTKNGKVMATSVTIPIDLWNRARNEHINISAFLSHKLANRFDDSKQKMLDYITGKDREIKELKTKLEAQSVKVNHILMREK